MIGGEIEGDAAVLDGGDFSYYIKVAGAVWLKTAAFVDA